MSLVLPYRCYNQGCEKNGGSNVYVAPGSKCPTCNGELTKLAVTHLIAEKPDGLIKSQGPTGGLEKRFDFACERAYKAARDPNPEKHPKSYTGSPTGVTCPDCLVHLDYTLQDNEMLPPESDEEEQGVN